MAAALAVITAACVVPHAAHVSPGAFTAVSVGVTEVATRTYDHADSSHRGAVLQFAGGYAWRRTLVYMVAPVEHPFGTYANIPTAVGSAVGIYHQANDPDARTAFGVGAMLGLSAQVYGMVGHRRGRWSIDGALRGGLAVHQVGPDSARGRGAGGSTAVRLSIGGVRVGAWVDLWVAADAVYDTGPTHTADRSLAAGLLLGR